MEIYTPSMKRDRQANTYSEYHVARTHDKPVSELTFFFRALDLMHAYIIQAGADKVLNSYQRLTADSTRFMLY